MKIITTEEQFYNLIPPSVKRRMTNKDFEILDGIIDNNKRYFIVRSFGEYLDGNLRDSLNEFIREYKVEELDPNLDNDDWDNEEDIIYKIFWQLIPFLKKKYHDVLYDYYMGYHTQRGNINESSDNKKKHLYRRIGEIEDTLKEYEDLFIRTAKGLDKDGFIHATSMFIGDILAGRLEEKGTDFDYVTFRNQIKVFVQSHFYQELIDFYNKHKKQLTESQDERLFADLPPFLRRRVTMEDFKWMDGKLNEFIANTPAVSKFDNFCDYALGDLLHEFLVDRKDDEIDTDSDPDYGLIYNDESLKKISNMYWELKPFLKKRYKDRLYKAWERKK